MVNCEKCNEWQIPLERLFQAGNYIRRGRNWFIFGSKPAFA